MTRSILIVFGTRPEAIKLAPLFFELRGSADFSVKTCVTAQHRELLDQVLDLFDIRPDHDLGIMRPDQTLYDITADGLRALAGVMALERPDIVVVQGDTTTAMIGALAGFYEKADVAHVEAGLRSGDRYSPYPEEMNRILVSRLAKWHFAPTESARRNLAREGIDTNVHVVGNTVIDAMHRALDLVDVASAGYRERFAFLSDDRPLVLVTGHRRENFGQGMRDVFTALRGIAEEFSERVEFIYPVHVNPNVQEPARAILRDLGNFHLTPPVSYGELVWLLRRCRFVVTDSGGIQEEAPALGKPVIVTRNTTERMEGVEAGNAILVGTDPHALATAVRRMLHDDDAYRQASTVANPYGDGTASRRIVEVLKS